MATPLSASTITSLEQDEERSRRIPQSQRRKEKNKVVAASLGAVITSLTMTPFDVVKFRLQAQEPALLPSSSSSSSSSSTSSSRNIPHFAPSHSSPLRSISSNTPWPPPIASTSASAVSLREKFEPRVASSTLPAIGGHGTSSTSTASSLRPSPLSPIYNTSFNAPSITSSSTATATLSLSSATHLSPSPPKHHLKGFRDAVYKIVKYEGASALWRGTTPALAMSVPGQVIYMVGYDWGRRTSLEHAPGWAYTSRTKGEGRGELSTTYMTGVPLVAGMISRTLVAILVSPIELLRTQLQSTHSSSSTSLTTIIRSLLHSTKHSSTSAWRGLGPTLWRDVPFSGIYWAGYEGLKRGMTGGKGMGEGWKDQGAWEEFRVSFLSGAGSGMIAATLTNPFDVIKTRRQALTTTSTTSTTSLIPTRTFPLFFYILKKEGWAGLMRGLTPRLAKVGPACGIMIGCYEGVGSWLE